MYTYIYIYIYIYSEHYPRDPDPEIRKTETTGDSVFHMTAFYFLNETVSGSGSLS